MMRTLNIALRTVHIASMGTLLGGHAFDVATQRLQASLWLTLGSGAVLAMVESGFRPLWLHQGRGVLTLFKLVLLLGVLVAWNHRLFILLAVVVVASVGSHMPSRFRYYSVLSRRVIHDGIGPGEGSKNSTT